MRLAHALLLATLLAAPAVLAGSTADLRGLRYYIPGIATLHPEIGPVICKENPGEEVVGTTYFVNCGFSFTPPGEYTLTVFDDVAHVVPYGWGTRVGSTSIFCDKGFGATGTTTVRLEAPCNVVVFFLTYQLGRELPSVGTAILARR